MLYVMKSSAALPNSNTNERSGRNNYLRIFRGEFKKPLADLVSTILFGGLIVISLVGNVALAQDSIPVTDAKRNNLWFIELVTPPTAEGGNLAKIKTEKANFRSAAAAAGIKYTERREYDVLFNGFSVSVRAADRMKLAQLPGVQAIYPVEWVQAPMPVQTGDSLPNLQAAITMTGAGIAQNELGLTGAGVKVGIIDSGIDIDHPAFGGTGTPNTSAFPSARIVAGYDFIGDNYSYDTPNIIPDDNPDDCLGHGTHVAGIVGGNGGGIKGVAPGVSLGAYRVFSCPGWTTTDIIVSAMEMALADGMQVINMSLGAFRQWPEYPTAKAASRLVNKGVVVVASIGNSGPGGGLPDAQFAASAPAVGDKVIGVASFDNAQRSFTVAGTPYGYNTVNSGFANVQIPAAQLPPTAGSVELVRTGSTTTTDDACSPLPTESLSGKAVLIRRGACQFSTKVSNAQNAGAVAVVMYNNVAGALSMLLPAAPAVSIPVAAVTAAQGAMLDGQIMAGTTTLTWTNNFVSWPYGTGGLISGFSSFGLTPELGLTPNIGAPGGGIFSAYPLELGGTATLSGTSMSSPHVAGGVALILEAKPKLPATTMLSRLQNSADPRNCSTEPATGLDHTHRQGAGMLDILGVIQATTVVSPGQISVGESEFGPRTTTMTVKNESAAGVTYDLAHTAALATGPNTTTGSAYKISGVYAAPATVTFSVPSITVPAGDSVSFEVTIDANPGLPERSIYGGYITLTPQGDGAVYRVPFAGLKGDYQSTQVLTPTSLDLPWLGVTYGGSIFYNHPSGTTFSMFDNDIPSFVVHLDQPSRRIRIEAFDAVTGKSWNRVSEEEYVTSNNTPDGAFMYTWDGNTFSGKGKNGSQWTAVPNGEYFVKISVLKALGDASNPAHWETWTSPTFTILRYNT